MDTERPADDSQQEMTLLESCHDLGTMISKLRAEIAATIKNAEDRDRYYFNRLKALNSNEVQTATTDCPDHQAPLAPSLIGNMDGPRNISRPPGSPNRDHQLPLFQQVHPRFRSSPNQRSTTAKRSPDGQALPAPGRTGDMNGARSISRLPY